MKRRCSISMSSVFLIAVPFAASPAFGDSMPTVSYLVSGSAGDWTVDFSVTNNTNQNLYLLGVELPTMDIKASPAGWLNNTSPFPGISGRIYQDGWQMFGAASIQPGDTLSGFEAIDIATAAPTGVIPFLTATCDTAYGPFAECGGTAYTGSGNENVPDNAVFESPASVPEPGSFFLLATLIGCVAAFWKRNAAVR